MKNRRQEKILELIAQYPIETQEELIERLAESGFRCTQSTVSRDMKQLHLVKELSSDKKAYRYTVSRKSVESDSSGRLQKILQECCVHCDGAQYLVVLKTLPGLAPAACSALDKMDIENLAGTLAGDDTAFIAMMDNVSAERFCLEIEQNL